MEQRIICGGKREWWTVECKHEGGLIPIMPVHYLEGLLTPEIFAHFEMMDCPLCHCSHSYERKEVGRLMESVPSPYEFPKIRGLD